MVRDYLIPKKIATSLGIRAMKIFRSELIEVSELGPRTFEVLLRDPRLENFSSATHLGFFVTREEANSVLTILEMLRNG